MEIILDTASLNIPQGQQVTNQPAIMSSPTIQEIPSEQIETEINAIISAPTIQEIPSEQVESEINAELSAPVIQEIPSEQIESEISAELSAPSILSNILLPSTTGSYTDPYDPDSIRFINNKEVYTCTGMCGVFQEKLSPYQTKLLLNPINIDGTLVTDVEQALSTLNSARRQVNVDWDATTGVTAICNKPVLASVATVGTYASLCNKPDFSNVAYTGSYNDLRDIPELSPAATEGQVNADWNATEGVAEILNKPSLSCVACSGNYNDLTNKPDLSSIQVQSDWEEDNISCKSHIRNKPTLSRVACSGQYADLIGAPVITPQVNADWNAISGVAQILNKPALAPVALSGDYNDLRNIPPDTSKTYSFSFNNDTHKLTVTEHNIFNDNVIFDTVIDTVYSFSYTDNEIIILDNYGVQHMINLGNDFYTKAEVDALIEDITDLIPEQASPTNQLADKAFVNSTIQTATANFRGNWATWFDVPTQAADYPEDYAGSKTPTINDYLVVQDASDYTEQTLEGTWRFKYTGTWSTDGKNGWIPEYQVNETPLTAAQLAALNSGITCEAVAKITDVYNCTISLCNSTGTALLGSFTLNQNQNSAICLNVGTLTGICLNNNTATVTNGCAKLDITPSLSYCSTNRQLVTQLGNKCSSAITLPAGINCTGTLVASDIANFITDIGVKVYCGTTCKCTLCKASSLCLGSNAFNSTAFTTCKGTVTKVTLGTSACSPDTSGNITLPAYPPDLSSCPGLSCTGTLVASDLNGYATESWVTGKNYCIHDCLVKLVKLTSSATSADRNILIMGNGFVDGCICPVYFSDTCKLTFNPINGQLKSSIFGYNKGGVTSRNINGYNSKNYTGGTRCTAMDICTFFKCFAACHSLAPAEDLTVKYTWADACNNTICWGTSNSINLSGASVQVCSNSYTVNLFNDSCSGWYNLTLKISCVSGQEWNFRACKGSYTAVAATIICNMASVYLANTATNATCFGGCTYACAKADIRSGLATIASLCTVATSGKYCDLTGTPSLCTVATSGCYCDLIGTPTIPAADDHKVTYTPHNSANKYPLIFSNATSPTSGSTNNIGYSSGCVGYYQPNNGTLWTCVLRTGVPTACTADVAGASGTIHTAGASEYYGQTPYIDFHKCQSCSDYSARIINDRTGKLSICVNNSYGCTATTEYSIFCFCSNGYLYGKVCGNLCGDAATFGGCTYTQACSDIRNGLATTSDIADMATCTWVNNQGYCTHDCLVKQVQLSSSSATTDRNIFIQGCGTVNNACTCIYVSCTCPLTYNHKTGIIKSMNTDNWSSVYSTNTYNTGYYLLAQLIGSAKTGNHDVTLYGTVFRNSANIDYPTTFRIYARGKCDTVNATSFRVDNEYNNIFATYEVDTTNHKFILRLYGCIYCYYTRYNTQINYAASGDVSVRISTGCACITFPNTYFDTIPDTETLITKTPLTMMNATCFNGCTYACAKADIRNGLATTASLATVATSGKYCDLTGTPTIPAAQVNSDWNAISGIAQILNKPALATVATSGKYCDLTGTPTIPAAANNGKITLCVNSTCVCSFTVNQSANTNITLPAYPPDLSSCPGLNCTGTLVASDIANFITDIDVKVYCGTTCKCTLCKASSLCLGSNAFNSTAFTTCKGTVTKVTLGTSACSPDTSGNITLPAYPPDLSNCAGLNCTGTVTWDSCVDDDGDVPLLLTQSTGTVGPSVCCSLTYNPRTGTLCTDCLFTSNIITGQTLLCACGNPGATSPDLAILLYSSDTPGTNTYYRTSLWYRNCTETLHAYNLCVHYTESCLTDVSDSFNGTFFGNVNSSNWTISAYTYNDYLYVQLKGSMKCRATMYGCFWLCNFSYVRCLISSTSLDISEVSIKSGGCIYTEYTCFGSKCMYCFCFTSVLPECHTYPTRSVVIQIKMPYYKTCVQYS